MPHPSAFIDVREPHTNRLLFRYDATRRLVEIQHRNVKTMVDLTQYDEAPVGDEAPQSAEGVGDERSSAVRRQD